jgi:hypothetical protein
LLLGCKSMQEYLNKLVILQKDRRSVALVTYTVPIDDPEEDSEEGDDILPDSTAEDANQVMSPGCYPASSAKIARTSASHSSDGRNGNRNGTGNRPPVDKSIKRCHFTDCKKPWSHTEERCFLRNNSRLFLHLQCHSQKILGQRRRSFNSNPPMCITAITALSTIFLWS